MMSSRLLHQLVRPPIKNLLKTGGGGDNINVIAAVRQATTSKYGGVLPEPHRTSFGVIRLFLTVIPGLLIGAAISKHIANFLEENDLFVPSDDDDDDD